MAIIKRCNVNAGSPVYNALPVVLHGNYNDIELTEGAIRACLCAGAYVDEILKDGSTIRLGFDNYTTDFSDYITSTPAIPAEKIEKEELPVDEETSKVVEPEHVEVPESKEETSEVVDTETVKEKVQHIEDNKKDSKRKNK